MQLYLVQNTVQVYLVLMMQYDLNPRTPSRSHSLLLAGAALSRGCLQSYAAEGGLEREREREREDSETRVEGRIEQLQITDEAWGQREGGEENNTKVDWVSWMNVLRSVFLVYVDQIWSNSSDLNPIQCK